MFTTYAPSEGFGGPARAFHQRRVLEDAGHTVTHVVIQASTGRGDTRRTDLIELCERPHKMLMDHIYADVDLAERAAADSSLVERVEQHLRSHSVDVIILEQPFLVTVVEPIVERLQIPVVYSCQNVEYRLRRDLERFQPDRRRVAGRSDEVRRLESRAVELSSVVTTICPTDRELMEEEFGCTSVLVPNGTSVAEMNLPPAASTRDPYFAFAGSAYWPNIEGFAEIANPSLAFLPPTIRIQIAGSVGGELLRTEAILRHQSANASRMTVRGFLSMDKLVAMMRRSRAVLVPVFIGEGSNLKSADALASGAPVIMTERATRGYEDVIAIDGDGITVVRSADAFRTAMSDALAHDPDVGSSSARRDLLHWSSRLRPLVDALLVTG